MTDKSRNLLRVIAIWCCMLAAPQCVLAFGRNAASKSAEIPGHFDEIMAVFEGYGKDGGLIELFDSTSTQIDKMPYELYEKYDLKKNFNGWTHRIVGHGNALDEEIPEEVLKRLEKEYGMPRDEMVRYWKGFQERLYEKAQNLTGLPKDKAKALVSFVWDLHLLGDLEPGNTAVKDVLEMEKIVDNITKHLKELLGDDSVFVENLRKKLLTILKEGRTPSEIAQSMMDTILKSKIGGRIYLKYKNAIKFKWIEDVAINAREWIEKRVVLHAKQVAQKIKEPIVSLFKKTLSTCAKYTSVATRSGEDVTAKTVEETARKSGCKNTKVTRGLLQKVTTKEGEESLLLSVPVVEGVSAGVLTFVISEGVTAVGFAKGDITEEEFWVETWKNVGASVVDGLAVGVVCCLGFGPAGVVAIAVGIGAYIIYDVVFTVLYDINKAKGITLDDYLGIMPTEIQRRPGALDYEGACRILNYEGTSPGLGFEGSAPGLEYKGNGHGLGEVPNIRKDGYGL